MGENESNVSHVLIFSVAASLYICDSRPSRIKTGPPPASPAPYSRSQGIRRGRWVCGQSGNGVCFPSHLSRGGRKRARKEGRGIGGYLARTFFSFSFFPLRRPRRSYTDGPVRSKTTMPCLRRGEGGRGSGPLTHPEMLLHTQGSRASGSPFIFLGIFLSKVKGVEFAFFVPMQVSV